MSGGIICGTEPAVQHRSAPVPSVFGSPAPCFRRGHMTSGIPKVQLNAVNKRTLASIRRLLTVKLTSAFVSVVHTSLGNCNLSHKSPL